MQSRLKIFNGWRPPTSSKQTYFTNSYPINKTPVILTHVIQPASKLTGLQTITQNGRGRAPRNDICLYGDKREQQITSFYKLNLAGKVAEKFFINERVKWIRASPLPVFLTRCFKELNLPTEKKREKASTRCSLSIEPGSNTWKVIISSAALHDMNSLTSVVLK